MRKFLGMALIAVLVAAVAAPALASSGAPVKNAKVDDAQFLFSPATLRIKKGTKVVWKWVDVIAGAPIQHNVAVKKGPVKFHSGLRTHGSFSHLFTKAGTYVLHCTIHPWMVEKVIVK